MNRCLLALLGWVLLLPACTRTRPLSLTADNTDLIAQMAVYGYKPYSGPDDTAFSRIKPTSLEAFKQSPGSICITSLGFMPSP